MFSYEPEGWGGGGVQSYFESCKRESLKDILKITSLIISLQDIFVQLRYFIFCLNVISVDFLWAGFYNQVCSLNANLNDKYLQYLAYTRIHINGCKKKKRHRLIKIQQVPAFTFIVAGARVQFEASSVECTVVDFQSYDGKHDDSEEHEQTDLEQRGHSPDDGLKDHL